MSKLRRFAIALILVAGGASAVSAQWSLGEQVTVNPGAPVTISTAQPDIFSLTVNGSLTFAAGGGVSITGNTSSAVGSHGGTGTMIIKSGALVKSTSGPQFFVGVQGGEGTLTIEAGGDFTLTGSLGLCANLSNESRDPATSGTVNIEGGLGVSYFNITPFFPNGPGDPYVTAGIINLLPGGVLVTGERAFRKNDRADSYVNFKGGTLKVTGGGAIHSVDNGGRLHYVVDTGTFARIDTAGNDVTFIPATANSHTEITGGGGLHKLGGGALVFRLPAGDNAFTGNITVWEGSLSLGRPLYPGQLVDVWDDATFVAYASSDLAQITYHGTSTGKRLFTVGGPFSTLDLLALSAHYHADRLGGPLTGSATLEGALTYDTAAGGGPLTPFRLITQGGTLCLTNTGLESAFVRIEGPSTVAFQGQRVFTAADTGKVSIQGGAEYQQQGRFTMQGSIGGPPARLAIEGPARFSTTGWENALEAGLNGDAVFVSSNATVTLERLRVAGGPGAVGAFIQEGGVVNAAAETWVGYDSGTGTLHVANGEFRVNASLRIALGVGDQGGRTYRPYGIVTVSNGLVRANELNFTPWWPGDASLAGRWAGEVNLLEGGVLDVAHINKNDATICGIFFDGGTLRIRDVGRRLEVSAGNGTVQMSATAGKHIALDIPSTNTWFEAQSGLQVFTGPGGLKKLGNGTLAFFANRADYLGDTIVEAGTLRLNGENVLPHGPGRGNLILNPGTTLDLNGHAVTLNRIEGPGAITNASANAATLGVFADGSDGVWTRHIRGGPVVLDKRGTGTLTLSGHNLTPAGLVISKGTVRITPAEGYAFYRFKVETMRDPSCGMMQLCELELYDNGVNVTPLRTSLLWDEGYSDTHLTQQQTYPENEAPPNIVNGNGPPPPSPTTVQGAGNKWLDFRIAADRSQTDRDRVWLQIGFAGPQKLTGYNWLTANDSPVRDPTAWRLQASHTGNDWVDLHAVSGYPITDWRFQWAADGQFPLDTTHETGQTLAPDATVTIAEGGALLLDNTSETIGGLDGFGTVNLDNADLTINAPSGAYHLYLGSIRGTGNLIKTGPGTQSLNGPNTFTGDLIIQDGTAEILLATLDLFRLTMKDTRGRVDILQLSEFALYDAGGTRRNLNLTEGTGTTTLNPGEYATPAPYAIGSSGEHPGRLFDNNLDSKWCLTQNRPAPDNPATWRTIVMRLPGGDDIASYNIATANDGPERDPVTWLLEGSLDGTRWITLDSQTGFIPTSNRQQWYNNGTPFPLSKRTPPAPGESAIPAGSTVEVRTGATLSIIGGTVPIGALRVDMAAGGGTITHFTPTASGALYLTNASGNPNAWTIPLTFGTVDNPSSLSKWDIYVDGQLLAGYRLSFDGTNLKLLPQGTLILVR